ncbi:MAG: glycosyltransferase family 1 protein [Chloroflexi bacterium]|nr:glycosyltransferase family 1 protein [Chloroflexota bacterium]
MKITVNTFGTRGDVQPYIALSLGLQRAGHTVRIVTHRIFESWVKQYGLDFYPLDIDPRQVLLNQAVSELGNNFIRINRWIKENLTSTLRDLFEATLDASRDADVVLNSGLSFAGWHVAEKLKIPALATYLWPVIPSHHLPAASGKIPPRWLPFKGTVNYLSTKLSNQMFFAMMSPLINECRKEILGLRPLTARDYWSLDSAQSTTPLIYGFSPSAIPKPADWGAGQQIAGYWFLDTDNYQPETTLLDFLANGPPPVYVGFGSMVDHEQQAINRLVIDALRETDQRGILLGESGQLDSDALPDFILRVDAIPHDWLLPRVAAVVHHGGAGTTAAALRAGVPSVVVPWFADQFFWGWRVQELGAGTKSIPRNQLTTARLASAIQQAVGDENIRRKASQLGKQIRAEDGVGVAVRLIEAFAHNRHF